MRKRTPFAGLVLSALWVHGAAQAPAAPDPAPAGATAESRAPLTQGEAKAMREFRLLDLNGDGKLSRTEVRLFPRLANAFDAADTDGDGYVSYAEVREFAAKYRAERERNRAAREAPAAAPAEPQTRP
ncbi:EF-hand domain-containing protein [Verminephrobacter aporrectodeae subsp. tuberculatae]|uniref:EF-hand domain-containing protein n=1 Tax=Verminephrobacter aporrectodeae TaxID=1110389 RepID=UPI002238A0F8|nr:EF-hand domain-containing protein [Verminephrobacter aporrectodeae]MCW5255698.1 EF-hand domain-containing protein [Verminephrobacter aporrectodeae subsp. tuberculatae]MCW8206418.1 EF-hand domain-containing protein [Verminephrobacter aporrectodeae subsp. tuberculatae]